MKLVTDIKEIQSYMLNVLVFVDKLCKEHNLRYSLAGGTLIGAIRHKGFISWDDDIDIFMPRPDFDRLINILNDLKSYDYGILNPYDPKSFYVGDILKVYNKNTILREYTKKYNLEYGVYIDIFPIDGLPEDILEAQKHYAKYNYYRKFLHIATVYQYRNKFDLKKIVSNILHPLSKYVLKDMIDYYHRYDFNSSKKCALMAPGNRLDLNILETDFFNNLIEVPFEDKKFLAFADYDVYLKRYYGDYMKFPPVEERQRPHNFELYV